jgi:catalase
LRHEVATTVCPALLADAARTRLVNNIVGQLLNGVSEPVLRRAFEYLRNVDKGLGTGSTGRPRRTALTAPI